MAVRFFRTADFYIAVPNDFRFRRGHCLGGRDARNGRRLPVNRFPVSIHIGQRYFPILINGILLSFDMLVGSFGDIGDRSFSTFSNIRQVRIQQAFRRQSVFFSACRIGSFFYFDMPVCRRFYRRMFFSFFCCTVHFPGDDRQLPVRSSPYHSKSYSSVR